MKLFKLYLFLIILNVITYAQTELTVDESRIIDSYIKDWPNNLQMKIKNDIDGMPMEGKKLIIQWYAISKPYMNTNYEQTNKRILFNIKQITDSYIKKDGNMESFAYKLVEYTKNDYPELNIKLQDLVTFSHEVDQATGKAETFDKEAIKEFASRKIVKDIKDGKEIGTQIFYNNKLSGYRPASINGKLEGKWEEYNKEGIKVFETFYKNGSIYGTAKRWYDDGKILSVSEFDPITGNYTYKEYYENGNLKETSLFTSNDLKNGKSEQFYENGKQKSIEFYTDSGLSDKATYYDEYGQKIKEVEYKDGFKNGKFLSWHHNGKIYQSLEYKNGMLHGSYKVYDENGKLEKDGEYYNGKSKYYREYQKYGTLSDIKLEEKSIDDKTTEVLSYSFKSNESDKVYLQKKWIEVNGKKHGKYFEFDYKGQKDIEAMYDKDIPIEIKTYYDGNLSVHRIYDKEVNQTKETNYDSIPGFEEFGQIKSISYFTGFPALQTKDMRDNKIKTEYYRNGKLVEIISFDKNGVNTEYDVAGKEIDRVLNSYLKDRSYGIGYHWLDLEEKIGRNKSSTINLSRKILDSLVYEVKENITLKNTYSYSEAREIMNTIGTILKKNNFVYDKQHIDIFSTTIINKAMDCDIISYLYVTIGDKLNLPIYMVHYPRHAALQWNDSGISFYWEATSHHEMSLEEYKNSLIAKYNAYQGVNKNRGYAYPMDRRQLLAAVFALFDEWQASNLFMIKAFELNNVDIHYPRFSELIKDNSIIYNSIVEREKIFGNKDYWDNDTKANMLMLINDSKAKKYIDLNQKFKANQVVGNTFAEMALSEFYKNIKDYNGLANMYEFLMNNYSETIEGKKHYRNQMLEARKKAMSPE